MSLLRLIYYSALISAWAAFVGWGVSEIIRTTLVLDPAKTSHATVTFVGYVLIAVTSGVIGAAIGMGLNVLGGMANGRRRELSRRALPGFLCGCAGGILGGLVGGVMFYTGLSRAIGWMVLGLGVGSAEGIYERSMRKIRNGLIGGAVGGLIGGLLFDVIVNMKLTESGRASRAAAFVVLGLFIGAAIGLAHVVFRVAWLTVVDGYRTGRQLMLTQTVTAIGRGDHVPLVFLGPTNKDLDAEHSLIRRMPDGSFSLEDNKTRLGTRGLTNQPVTASIPLADGDVIRLGTNLVRFNERRRRHGDATIAATAPAKMPSPPPPPGQPPSGQSPPPLRPSGPLPRLLRLRPASSSADRVFAPEPRPWLPTKKP